MALLQRAHERAYRFPAGFAGFSALLTSGATLEVKGKREFTLSEGDAWTREQIASILGHRWALDYETEGDGRFGQNEQDDGDPTGTLVRLEGDPLDSSYRVTDRHEIAEVHRTAGDTRFTIVISSGFETGVGRLPQNFSVYYWNLGGRLTKVDQYRDQYTEVDGVWLPSRRTVTTATDAGLSSRVLTLTDHQLRVV